MGWFTAPDYWLSRLVFQRALAGVYLIAFLAAALVCSPETPDSSVYICNPT